MNRMYDIKTRLERFGSVLGLLIVFGLSGCDTTGVATEPVTGSNLDVPAAALITDLNLSNAEAQQIVDILSKYDNSEPGRIWYAAAELQETLTDEQKEALIASAADDTKSRAGRSQLGPSHKRATREGARFMESISGLTEEQKDQLKTIREEHGETMRSLIQQRREGTLSVEDMKTQVEEMREQVKNRVDEILTEEQRAELEAEREEMKERFTTRRNAGDNPGASGRAGKRGQRDEVKEAVQSAMIDALDLTPEQQVQLEEVREGHLETLQNMREELKAADREEARAALESVHNAMQEGRDAILTDKQKEVIAIHRAVMVKVRSSVGEDERRTGRRKIKARNG